MEKLTSIEEVRAEMHMEFAMVSARFNEADSRFNQVDARFNKVDEQFVSLETQLLAMQKTFVKWGATLSISLFVTAVGVIVAAFLTL